MEPALWISKTGLEAQQTDVSVISNNLANVNTNGFKKGRAVFEDLLYQTVEAPGTSSSADTELPSGLLLGTGVNLVATKKLFTQGNINNTDNALDLAISGRGFFQILRPDGTTGYSRDGNFQLSSDGQIVNSKGYALQPSISIPADAQNITIGSDGIISVTQPGNAAPTQVGQIQLADFINPAGLEAIGENMYTETAASGTPTTNNAATAGMGSLLQGSLETSNVNVVEELVNLIETQRAYEMNAKAIETIDAMLQYVSQTL